MRVGLYLRVSTGEQTVANQERELVEAAQRHGWQVVATYRDEGIRRQRARPEASLRPALPSNHSA